jgi:hypothetical protein
MRWLLLALVCGYALVLTGCDEERTGGEVVGPLLGPRVAESVLALEVIDGVPVGITDIFVQGEDVHLWVHWEDLHPPHEAEAFWFDPFAEQVGFTVLEITGRAAEQITVFTLELTEFSETGRWDVELYLDGEFQRSHSFLVVDILPG